jgi:zinc-binding alcohol dehydrogenase/oxidoreductase
MRAIVLQELGGPDGLQPAELPDPIPAPGEAVVEVVSAAINRRDVWIRAGRPDSVVGSVLGSDAAGRVVAHGEGISTPLLGAEVIINPAIGWGPAEDAPAAGWNILGMPRQGTYAERIAVPASDLVARPANLTWHESAALPLAGLTAWRALVTKGQVAAGDRVLIAGAGAGTSTFLVQIARALGADVTVTSSSETKIERSIELGASRGVLYTDPEWAEQVGEVDVIIDSAGGPTWDGAWSCLRPGGRLVCFGRTTGQDPVIPLPRVYFGQWTISGTTMGSPREFAALVAHVNEHHWRPVIDSAYPLADTAAAHARMDAPERFGKVVLEVLA